MGRPRDPWGCDPGDPALDLVKNVRLRRRYREWNLEQKVHLETRAKYFILRNEPIASGRPFGDSMSAGKPMELGARSWAIGAALFTPNCSSCLRPSTSNAPCHR
jgi:hypothetical protein